MFHNLQAYPGLTQAQHRALPHVSNTDLSNLKAQVLGQLRKPNPQALAFGSHFHAATLEPATYARTAGEMSLAAAGAAGPPGTPPPLLPRPALPRHRRVDPHGHPHRYRRAAVKIRPDLLVTSRAGRRTTLVDFKTTSCLTYPQFLATTEQYDYDRQAALYLDALSADRFMIIGVQKKVQHAVWVFDATAAPGFIAQCRKKYTALLRHFALR